LELTEETEQLMRSDLRTTSHDNKPGGSIISNSLHLKVREKCLSDTVVLSTFYQRHQNITTFFCSFFYSPVSDAKIRGKQLLWRLNIAVRESLTNMTEIHDAAD